MKKRDKLAEAKTYEGLAFAAYNRGDLDEAQELSMLALGAASKAFRKSGNSLVEALMPSDVPDGAGANSGDNLMTDPPSIQNEFPEMQDVDNTEQSGDPDRTPLASIEARISNVVAYLAKAGLPVSLDSNNTGFVMTIAMDMDHEDHMGEWKGEGSEGDDEPYEKSETWSGLSSQKAVLNANAVLAQSRGDLATAKKFRRAAKTLA